MDIQATQGRLIASGYSCTADGIIGPITYAALLGYAAQRQLGPMGQSLGAGMAASFPAKGISSDLNVAHWIAQMTHETEEFRYLTELGGSDYFKQYEFDKGLGNTHPGDGFAYRGRGLIQITGRWNYRHFGEEVGEPLETNPGLAAQPSVAVKIACQFWSERGIIPLADDDDIERVTRKVNGGLNGLSDREAILLRVKTAMGI